MGPRGQHMGRFSPLDETIITVIIVIVVAQRLQFGYTEITIRLQKLQNGYKKEGKVTERLQYFRM